MFYHTSNHIQAEKLSVFDVNVKVPILPTEIFLLIEFQVVRLENYSKVFENVFCT